MATLTQLIALTLTRNQLLTLITNSGHPRILHERKTTSTLRRFVMDLILAAGNDDNT